MNSKASYKKQQDEPQGEEHNNSGEDHQQHNADQNKVTDRSSIMEDQKSKEPNQFNDSYYVTYTQGNMTTNSNNLSISKVDLNSLPGKYKSANTSSGRNGIENGDYPIDSNNIHILSNEDNNNVLKDLGEQSDKVVILEMADISKDKNKNNEGIKKGKKKQHIVDLQIEIPDSDEEKKNKKVGAIGQVGKAAVNSIQQNKISNISDNTSQKQKEENKITDNPESARVNEIIQHNRLDVENLETIQIDYDSETIEGLTDDQCLELYCEGSVKLKNSQRLHCKIAYEQLLIDKIRSTTRLIYTNLGIMNSGNLSSPEFIADSIVVPLKRLNPKFKTTDISEAFTVQCADYIHFNLRKSLSLSLKLFFVLSLMQLICFIIKFQDTVYQKLILIQIIFILLTLLQLSASYFYISGVYSCNDQNIYRGIRLNQLIFILNITEIILEGFFCSYFSAILNNSLHKKENFKQFLFYLIQFLISIALPPIIHKKNKVTCTAVRKIVKIASDEFIE